MTQEEIIEMARQADIDHHRLWNDDGTNRLEYFSKLVASKEREACIAHAMTSAERAIDVAIKLEREACANICEGYSGYKTAFCALKIRARGKE